MTALGLATDPEAVHTPLPLVSVGLPVYNGARYLEASIASLLAQTYENVELIICDNCSTDETPDICRRFADSDPRVRYQRNDENIGGAKNHNLTFVLARGKYFRWAAHDDIAEPELIASCVEVMERDPSIVVCHTDFVHIDGDGDVRGYVSRNHCSSTRAATRFARMASARDFCEETYGLIRSDIFARTELQQDYTGSDRTLMSELALYGPFYNIGRQLFSKRLHPGNEYVDWRTRMAWFGTKYTDRVNMPWWKQAIDYPRVIRRVPLTSRDRWGCYAYMARWYVEHAPKLIKDLLVALGTLIRSREERRRRTLATTNWGRTDD
jgi:glycosyltransferase involved in cell wall biosynthesis